jgi:hypothetical protein
VSDRDFAFIGVKTGKTEIQIRADDKIVLRIEAVVTDQPASP